MSTFLKTLYRFRVCHYSISCVECCPRAYEMLKGAVMGGPSLVFTRKHEAGKTVIGSHRYENARTCQRVLGYDANALYPSTMLQEMPCGPGKVVHYENLAEQVDGSVSWNRDIRVPKEQWENSKNSRLCFLTVLFHRRRFQGTWKSIWNQPSEASCKTISFVGGS